MAPHPLKLFLEGWSNSLMFQHNHSVDQYHLLCSPFFPAHIIGFPDSSVGKKICLQWRTPLMIPGSRRSPGEGIGYPLQYSWASLVVQLVKNLPAVWETWVWSLVWEDPLEKGKATHSSPGLENSVDYSPWGHKESDMTEQLWLSLSFSPIL